MVREDLCILKFYVTIPSFLQRRIVLTDFATNVTSFSTNLSESFGDLLACYPTFWRNITAVKNIFDK